MKLFIRCAPLCFVISSLGLISTTQACDPFGETIEPPLQKHDGKTAPKQIQVYTEIIEITALEYAEIMTKPSNSNNHTALRNSLIEQVKNNQAKLVSNQSIITSSGQNAITVSLHEFIYETEYEPAKSIPSEQVSPLDPTVVSPPEPPSKSSEIIFPPAPTAFETRNLGSELEAEAILGEDGKIITLRFKTDFMKLLGHNVLGEWNTVLSKTKVQMPIFYNLHMETILAVMDGEFTLVGTHTPEVDGKPDESKKLLVFVKASVLEVGK